MAAINLRSVRDQLGFSHYSLPLVISCGFWTYALTAPATGRIVDWMGGKKGVQIAALGSGFSSLALGAAVHFDCPWLEYAMAALFSLNLAFQGFGTAAAVKLNAAWYTSEEMGVFSGVFNVCVTSGYFLALAVSGWVLESFPISFVFLIPGVLLLVVALSLGTLELPPTTPCCSPMPILEGEEDARESFSFGYSPVAPPTEPAADGAGPAEADHGHDDVYRSGAAAAPPMESAAKYAGTADVDQGVAAVEWRRWAMYFCVFWSGWVQLGLITWVMAMLKAEHVVGNFNWKGSSSAPSPHTLVGAAITLGGCFGGLLIGYVSDRCFKAARELPILYFSFLQILCLKCFYDTVLDYGAAQDGGGSYAPWIMFVLLLLSCVCICGIYSLLNYAMPADQGVEGAAAATGTITLLVYLASGMSGVLMARIIADYGWDGWLESLVFGAVIGPAALVVLLASERFGLIDGRAVSQPREAGAASEPAAAAAAATVVAPRGPEGAVLRQRLRSMSSPRLVSGMDTFPGEVVAPPAISLDGSLAVM